MKKLLGMMLVLVVIMTACGAPKESDNNMENEKKASNTSQSVDKEKGEDNKTEKVENNFSKDTIWNVEGELELKVDSVKMSEDKKSFVIKYTYKNNSDDKSKKLIMEPEFVYDKEKNVLEKDESFTSKNKAKEVSKGKTCEGAEVAYKLMVETDILDVEFAYLSSDGSTQKVIFHMPVE